MMMMMMSVVGNLRLLILCHIHLYAITNISKDRSDFKMVLTVYQAT